MKKIIGIVFILILSVFVLTGCGGTVNLDKIETNVKSLNTEIVSGMQPVEDLAQYGISADYLESYLFYMNPENMDMWAVLVPQQDKVDAVKGQMDEFISTMSLNDVLKVVSKYASILKDEFNGYLVYIATATENSEILDKIKN